jgi:hypothetical protein
VDGGGRATRGEGYGDHGGGVNGPEGVLLGTGNCDGRGGGGEEVATDRGEGRQGVGEGDHVAVLQRLLGCLVEIKMRQAGVRGG